MLREPALDALILDDDRGVAEALVSMVRDAGHTCAFETDPARALARLSETRVLLLDLMLPGVRGFDLLDEVRRRAPRVPVVMVTGHGTVKIAVEAMRRGAFDFIVKPPEREEIAAAVAKALACARSDRQTSDLWFDLPGGVVFGDARTLELAAQVRRVAPTDLVVLISGESGVGKEIFARLVHEWSPRAARPLVKINCAAIPEPLFESELFGHEKGAFTGAAATKPGRVELAEGGTLFLDEVGELPVASQAKLLEFLQDHTFHRVGGLRTLTADVRLVAATNRDLAAESSAGRFRRDLYFRLAGLEILVPPLRERPDDVEALALHTLGVTGSRFGRAVRFAGDALAALRAHAWPGNVRELEHVIERAVALADGSEIAAADLFPNAPAPAPATTSLRDGRREFDRARVLEALARSGGNRTAAAKELGITRRMLQIKLRDLGES